MAESELGVDGADSGLPSLVPDGLQLQLLLRDDQDGPYGEGVRAYYARDPMKVEDSIRSFVVAGGVAYFRHATKGRDFASYRAHIGERANGVRVGEHDAALIWADPIADGFRHYGIYWSDGEFDYELFGAFETADASVEMARSVHCR